VKPDGFLEVTQLVSTGASPQTEPFFRSAISRAYYAAHLSARELYLGRRKISPNSRGIVTHRMMIRALKGSRLPGLGHQLDQLLDARIEADYDLRASIQSNELQAAVTIVARILQGLPASTGGKSGP
jgi:uncharacterized protein (UPF0332 family)